MDRFVAGWGTPSDRFGMLSELMAGRDGTHFNTAPVVPGREKVVGMKTGKIGGSLLCPCLAVLLVTSQSWAGEAVGGNAETLPPSSSAPMHDAPETELPMPPVLPDQAGNKHRHEDDGS